MHKREFPHQAWVKGIPREFRKDAKEDVIQFYMTGKPLSATLAALRKEPKPGEDTEEPDHKDHSENDDEEDEREEN